MFSLIHSRSADADTYVKVAQWLLSRVSYLQVMLPLLESDAIGLALLGGFVRTSFHMRR